MPLKPLLLAFPLIALAACAARPSETRPAPAREELYRVDSPAEILAAARSLMASDENMALVTVDDNGQPRVRTVRAFPGDIDPADPRSGMTVWVMTRESTRKVGQVQAHPQVTLYFNDDPKTSYLTIMGTATVHTNPEHPAIRSLLARKELEGYAEYFWPDFPAGFVMIEVTPCWIEFMEPTAIKPQAGSWRPQAVVFDDAGRAGACGRRSAQGE